MSFIEALGWGVVATAIVIVVFTTPLWFAELVDWLTGVGKPGGK